MWSSAGFWYKRASGFFVSELADTRLSSSARRLLRSLTAVITPPGEAEQLGVLDATLDETELMIRSMPRLVRMALVAGMTFYDLAAVLYPGNGGKRAGRLDGARARRYYLRWKNGLSLQRELVKGVKGIVGIAYYEQRPVQVRMGYDPHAWIDRARARRLESYHDEIERQEASIFAPDPIELPSGGRAEPAVRDGADDRPAPVLHGHTHANPPPGVLGRGDVRADTTYDCDVVIVGSGAGGATTAAELAEAGIDVMVLEEGSYWGTGDFGANAAEMIRRMYRDGGASAALGHPPVLFQEGRTVGGSSVINGAMSWRTPERILDHWQDAFGLTGLDARAMEPYFARVERRIHVAHQDPETIGIDSQLLRKGAEAKGWRYEDNLRNQLHCAGSNNCAFGCPTGGKQSTLVTYIPRALHFGARVHANVRVDRILLRGGRAAGVEGRVVGEGGKLGHRVTVRAKLVVSSGGSIQTPALLWRSGFRSSSGQLGRNLSMHPNTKVVAIFDEEVRGWEGVHQAYQVREHEEQGIVTLAAVNIPPGIIAMSLPHDGEELGELMSQYPRAVVAGLLCEDTSRGRVRMAPGGTPFATYHLSDFDLERIKMGTKLLCELLLAAGAKRIILPFRGVEDVRTVADTERVVSPRIPRSAMEVVTVHLMGTARMGGRESDAVTDGFGRVYGAEGLFVCDASLFPSAIGVNPCETIQALSTRNAAHIIENRGRYLR